MNLNKGKNFSLEFIWAVTNRLELHRSFAAGFAKNCEASLFNKATIPVKREREREVAKTNVILGLEGDERPWQACTLRRLCFDLLLLSRSRNTTVNVRDNLQNGNLCCVHAKMK